MTAGHCCDDVSGFNVVAGGVSLQTSEDEIEQKRTVSKNGIFIHESYNDTESNNDICLILVSVVNPIAILGGGICILPIR